MQKVLTFHDHKPETLSLREAVIEGLSRNPKSIEPKFFYNERGSELFDRICEQPEYYLPTVEQKILLDNADEIVSLTGPGRILIEPGAGNAAKVRLLLDTLQPAAYVPMDISFDYLKLAASSLIEDYPWLRIHAACVDFTVSMPVPDITPEGPRLLFFPGSSIGNFEQDKARRFLAMVRDTVGEDGMLLIGVDTRKDETILNAAYNDSAGITARFNLNLLHRFRDELEMDCDPAGFDHRAFYNGEAGRIEMHLVSRQKQTLRMNGHSFDLDCGETLHTESSYKYAPQEFLRLAASCGFNPLRHWQDEKGLFSIYLLAAS
ncbi:MAG: L-histidine N(alpha)-methyltransferase [Gammaproteobacteria bacterium]